MPLFASRTGTTLLVLAAAIIPSYAQLYNKTIVTNSGPMQGFKYFSQTTLERFYSTSDSNVAAFLGIPYAATTKTCIYGGPHTYKAFKGDTFRKIALAKFNVTVEALWGLSGKMTGVSSVDEEIDAGTTIKVPQCNPSRCAFEPLYYTCGTYKDLAVKYNTTPGQIFALNPSFNHSSETGPGVGGWITLPMDCHALGDVKAVS